MSEEYKKGNGLKSINYSHRFLDTGCSKMCDTFVAVGSASVDGSTIFGKNSDRPYQEIQNLIHIPRQSHTEETFECTYIQIPQNAETFEVLLCQPYWIWGAEMGANEWGVVVGNEAVHSKELAGPPALLGMDLLRLGLERGKTARATLEVITKLLEEFGQGGSCKVDEPAWTYDNSFLIADAKEAWVLETAGKWWIAERIVDNIRNISNCYSIRTRFDLSAEGLVDYALEQGYWDASQLFNFAEAFSRDPVPESPPSLSREGRGRFLLEISKGTITPQVIMGILRDHDTGICAHDTYRTTGSMVSRIDARNEFSLHWFTGTPNPCQSFFKPLFMGSEIPPQFVATTNPDPNTLWWAHELLQVKTPNRLEEVLPGLEKQFLRSARQLLDSPTGQAQRKKLFSEAFQAEWALYQQELRQYKV